MPVADEAYHVLAAEALLGRPLLTVPSSLQDLQNFYRRYTLEVALPALSAPRNDCLTVYGLIRKSHKILSMAVANENSVFCNQNPGTLQAYATTSMLFFIYMSFIKKDRSTTEIIPMLDPLWHQALRDRRGTQLFMHKVFTEKLDFIWSRMPANDEAMMYLLRHIIYGSEAGALGPAGTKMGYFSRCRS